jgi:PKD repeat protein
MRAKHAIAILLIALVALSGVASAASMPTPNFKANTIKGYAPMKVTFTYTGGSISGVKSHKWSYGDGYSCYTCWHPSHTYTKPGRYTVSLAVRNAAGTRTKTITNYITVLKR